MRLRHFALGFVVLATLAASWLPHVQALDVPPRPTTSPVVDQTGTLTTEQQATLTQTILDEEKASSNQIGVLIVASLDGQAIEDYSLQVARAWGIGTNEHNNGVLLLIAKNDRQLRIEVGYGLEGALTDARANRIIRDRITPLFREGKYYEGIASGVEGIVAAIHNEYDADLQPEGTTQKKASIPWEALLVALFVVPSWLGAMLARTKSWWAGGVLGGIGGIVLGTIFGFVFIGILAIIILILLGLLFDKVVSANYREHAAGGYAPSWWAGGPFIGGGRNDSGGWGGFGGSGGGGFGGGGSSGSW